MSAGADWSDLIPQRGGAPEGGVRIGAWVRGALYTIVPVLLVSAVFMGARSVDRFPILLPVERLELAQTPRHTGGEAIRNAVAPYLHESMLWVDVRGARRALEELPWVAGAAVRREWPNGIVIRVRERQPVARWRPHDAGTADETGQPLVDGTGEVFVPAAETVPGGLPHLAGPGQHADDVVALYQRVSRLLAGAGVNVATLELAARGSWSAELDNGARVEMGQREPLERIERFVAALPTLREHRDEAIRRVDLRHPNGFAVAWGDANETD